MTSNSKLTVLWTQAPERKGSTGLDTNHYQIKTRLAVALKYTHSPGKWKMWKLILCQSFRKLVHIDSGSAQFKHPDRSLSQHIETLHCEIWWNFVGRYVVLACISYVYDLQTSMRLGEDVYFPPITTDSNLRVSVIGLYHSAPYC